MIEEQQRQTEEMKRILAEKEEEKKRDLERVQKELEEKNKEMAMLEQERKKRCIRLNPVVNAFNTFKRFASNFNLFPPYGREQSNAKVTSRVKDNELLSAFIAAAKEEVDMALALAKCVLAKKNVYLFLRFVVNFIHHPKGRRGNDEQLA